MGERQRGEGKPETLLARNAKLASNTPSSASPALSSPASHANKLALNSATDTARPTDAVASN
jgi:hypothetical protein